jgi:hypothetical protein
MQMTRDEYYDFKDLLENATYSRDPTINNQIAERILKKLEEED